MTPVDKNCPPRAEVHDRTVDVADEGGVEQVR